MSETNTQTADAPANIPDIPLPEISITRNNITVALSPYKIVKGDRKGMKYLAPTITAENFDQMVAWYGKVHAANVLQKNTKNGFQGIWSDAIDEATGAFLQDKFVKDAEMFTESGLKKAEIETQIDECTGRQLQLMESPMDASGNWSIETQTELRKTAALMTSLRAMLDEKTRKGKAEKEAAAAVEVK